MGPVLRSHRLEASDGAFDLNSGRYVFGLAYTSYTSAVTSAVTPGVASVPDLFINNGVINAGLASTSTGTPGIAADEEEVGAYWAGVVGRAPYAKEGTGNDGEMSDDGSEKEERGDVLYLVRKEPGAEPQRVPRSKPRHRVFEKQCHPGITDDKKNGS